MDKQEERDYLANDLINQKHFENITSVIDDPNHDWVMKNTIDTIPEKVKLIKNDRPMYNSISGIEQFDQYDFLYRHFHLGMYEGTFFTTNNIEKVRTLFPGTFTLKSVNSYISEDINNYEQLQNILISNRQLMNWVIIKKPASLLTIENKKITLSFITLFIVSEKSIQFYLYNKGLLFLTGSRDIKTLPEDFENQFGNTFYHDKLLPKVRDILRKGIGKFEKTLIRENGMRYKKNFLLYYPMEVLFEVDMNYNVYLQKIQTPREYIKDFNVTYTTDVNTIIDTPDAPNGFSIIINDVVYIPHAPEQKVKKVKNILGSEKKTEKVVIDESYSAELKQDIKDSATNVYDDIGDFKWVILAVLIIAIFVLFIIF